MVAFHATNLAQFRAASKGRLLRGVEYVYWDAEGGFGHWLNERANTRAKMLIYRDVRFC